MRSGRAALPALLAALLTLLPACSPSTDSSRLQSPTLERIRSRDRLLCGSNGQLPGFSAIRSDGSYGGLDVDLCRALAAAVLRDPAKLELRLLNTADRFAALASGDVDLLSRNTTISLSRDAAGGNGLSFAPPILYDGGGLMARRTSGMEGLADLAGSTVCVLSGSSNEQVIADQMRSLGLRYTPLRFRSGDEAFSAYESGRCQAITSDRAGLAARRSRLRVPADHRLLEVVLSKEPLAAATGQADVVWADVVRWVVYGLIEAEEQGITQANVRAKLAAAQADPSLGRLRRLLGVEGELGRRLGLADDFVVKMIEAVGHYGEIYERNLGSRSPLQLPRAINRLASQGGLMQAPPFQ
ncbi:MAG: amino acid ABC transporter substrate-binding protein [Cyanobium sp.]